MRDSAIRLVGHRLILRGFVTPTRTVHAFTSHPLATRFMTCGPHSLQDTRAFLREAIAQAGTPSRTSFDLAVVDVELWALISSAALAITSTEHRRGEIGYVLHPDFWSKGLTTEAARIALLRRAGWALVAGSLGQQFIASVLALIGLPGYRDLTVTRPAQQIAESE